VPEWLKGADCKSAGVRLRWFESNPLHQKKLLDSALSARAEVSTVEQLTVLTPYRMWNRS
jgi:hypothetical protein